MEKKDLIANAERFLENNREFAEDIEAYAECYETAKNSFYGFNAAYNLVQHLVDKIKEDC